MSRLKTVEDKVFKTRLLFFDRWNDVVGWNALICGIREYKVCEDGVISLVFCAMGFSQDRAQPCVLLSFSRNAANIIIKNAVFFSSSC